MTEAGVQLTWSQVRKVGLSDCYAVAEEGHFLFDLSYAGASLHDGYKQGGFRDRVDI